MEANERAVYLVDQYGESHDVSIEATQSPEGETVIPLEPIMSLAWQHGINPRNASIHVGLASSPLPPAIADPSSRLVTSKKSTPITLADERVILTPKNQQLFVDGTPLDIQARTFTMLHCLALVANRVYPWSDLYEDAWYSDRSAIHNFDQTKRLYTVRRHAKMLRDQIYEVAPDLADYERGVVRTIRGVGLMAVKSLAVKNPPHTKRVIHKGS